MHRIITMGIDIGSAAAKCLILENGKEIISASVYPAGIGTSGPEKAVYKALEKAGLKKAEIDSISATGYGRNIFPGAEFTFSELSCHAAGAFAENPEVKTLIDIGGQDIKAIRVGSNGVLDNFIMNDKCAAGTGRFLEVMAKILEIDVSELEREEQGAEKPLKISSTCTVFAESEVVSLLAAGADRRELIAGIHQSVAVKAAGLAKRLGVSGKVMMTGGAALNGGIVRALSSELGTEVLISSAPQLAGAYGAAILGFKKKTH